MNGRGALRGIVCAAKHGIERTLSSSHLSRAERLDEVPPEHTLKLAQVILVLFDPQRHRCVVPLRRGQFRTAVAEHGHTGPDVADGVVRTGGIGRGGGGGRLGGVGRRGIRGGGPGARRLRRRARHCPPPQERSRRC